MENYTKSYMAALRDFHQARNEALKEKVWAKLTGQNTDLISFDEVRTKLKLDSSHRKGLQDIPLDAIIGSVGRYSDFTRKFNPRQDSDAERWAKIEVKIIGMEGLPPIEVYKVGESYFVIDGNHRVSVAHHLGFKSIEAYVTEVETRVPLPPDAKPDDIILQARYAAFLERTKLDILRPGADLTATVPGQYRVLEQHIELHRAMLEIERRHEITYQDAMLDWYDNVYSVVTEVIREQNIQKNFPQRTETDIYLWISGYRIMLQDSEEWGVDSGAAEDDANNPDMPALNLLPRLVTKLRGEKSAAELAAEVEGISPSEWRRELLTGQIKKRTKRLFRLFTNILVPVSGDEVGWYALHQALGIARREGGRLLGLHVIPDSENINSVDAKTVKTYFNRHCTKAGIPGRLTVETGNVAQKICERSRFVDLIVIKLNHPPTTQPLARLESGFRTLIRQCNSPILAVPKEFVYPLDQILLAYDGSPKSREALFIATYLTSRWKVPLTVLTVASRVAAPNIMAEVETYLQPYNVEAKFVVTQTGSVAETIIDTAQKNNCNLTIMGGYGYNPMLELMLGSTVDAVLRSSLVPTLICH